MPQEKSLGLPGQRAFPLQPTPEKSSGWSISHGPGEYCRHRPLENVHHRTYASFGQEPLEDLMGVCRTCHRRIHRIGGTDGFAMQEGSLADLGDTGTGDSPLWRDYLGTGA